MYKINPNFQTKKKKYKMLHFPKINFFVYQILTEKMPINPYYDCVLVKILKVAKKTKKVSI